MQPPFRTFPQSPDGGSVSFVLPDFLHAQHIGPSVLRWHHQHAIDKIHLPGPDREIGVLVFLLVDHRHVAIFPTGQDRFVLFIDYERPQLERHFFDFRDDAGTLRRYRKPTSAPPHVRPGARSRPCASAR